MLFWFNEFFSPFFAGSGFATFAKRKCAFERTINQKHVSFGLLWQNQCGFSWSGRYCDGGLEWGPQQFFNLHRTLFWPAPTFFAQRKYTFIGFDYPTKQRIKKVCYFSLKILLTNSESSSIVWHIRTSF